MGVPAILFQGRARTLALAALLATATVAAYSPSLSGGYLWDDPEYVVNNQALRSARGLLSMWTSIRSLPQWYPMVHTTYWVEYQLVGLNPMVSRVINLLLHIATALMLWRLLAWLDVPGAFLAAVVFALHPVHVESVAWITERKNALSGFFYLAAFLAYWRWRSGPSDEGWYVAALALFSGALLSKSVTASFPAAMLVVIWWQTGRVRLADIRPLLPFFVGGIAMGLVTAYLERHHVGAIGREWTYAPTWYGEWAARTLIAGRAVWFYAGKVFVPYPLAFIYERWAIDATDWRQWLYPVSALGLLALVALNTRHLGRGALAALLLFGGTLLPALGFFNVYPHRYSFVADHFQYLASIPLITLAAAAFTSAIVRSAGARLASGFQAALVLLVGGTLGVLSWVQSHSYASALALWQDTAAKTPTCWVAFTNLGKLCDENGEHTEAVGYHRRALELAPEIGDTWFALGKIHAADEQWEQAIAAFNRARLLASQNRIASGVYLDSTAALGRIALLRHGDVAAAERYFQEALAARPAYKPVLLLLGYLYEETGRTADALDQYQLVIGVDPDHFEARLNSGRLLAKLGKHAEAAEQFSRAVAIRPSSAEAKLGLADSRSRQHETPSRSAR